MAIGCLSKLRLAARSVEHAALIGGDHVLDVNESIVTTVHLEALERLLDKVAQVLLLALGVVNAVTHVAVLCLEQVHHGKDLAVVGHEGLADGVTALHKLLQDHQSSADNGGVSRGKSI